MSWIANLPARRWFAAVFLLGLLLTVVAAYAPSLYHVPRADQWAYLIDTRLCSGFTELLAESYSYNRVRVVGPGDTDLFRPLLFGLLALEKHMFGNWFLPGQALGIFLHASVICLLFVILRRVVRFGASAATQNVLSGRPAERALQWAPFAVTTFFALNFAIMELVVWAHLHGYLLFLILVLASLLCVWDLLYRDDLTPRRRGATYACCWLLLLLAAFTYELGQFYAMLVGATLACRGWKQGRARAALLALAFAAILPLYQTANRLDHAYHSGRTPPEDLRAEIMQQAFSAATLEHSARFAAFTIVQPFFPAATGWWYYGERIHLQDPFFGYPKYLQPRLKVLLSYGIAGLFFGLTLAGCWRFLRSSQRPLWPIALLPAALLALYAGMIVLGRMNLRSSPYVLCSNSYYTYTALVLFLVAAVTLWRTVAVPPWLMACLGGGLVFLGGYSAGRVHHVNERLRSRYADFHAAVAEIDAFIQAHRNEPGFGLAFDMRPDDPFPVTHSIPFPCVFFAEWIDNHEPSHVVVLASGRAEFIPIAPYRSRNPQTTSQLFPDLVRVGTSFNIWAWQGRYYGTLHWDDAFRPELKDHAYVIDAETLEGVLDEVPVRFEEFMEDLRTGYCIPPSLETEMIDQYRGFTLTEAGSYLYATPAAEGPFVISRFNGRRYSVYYVANDAATLQHYIDEYHADAAAAASLKRD